MGGKKKKTTTDACSVLFSSSLLKKKERAKGRRSKTPKKREEGGEANPRRTWLSARADRHTHDQVQFESKRGAMLSFSMVCRRESTREECEGEGKIVGVKGREREWVEVDDALLGSV